MQNMTLQKEWLSTILAKSTRQSCTVSMKYFLGFMGLSKCEDLKTIEKPETRALKFYQWLQDKKGLCCNSAVARVVAACANGISLVMCLYSLIMRRRK